MKHRARKRFGQHFLTDRLVVARILEALAPEPGELVIEIGPGQAALTRPLLEAGVEIIAVEIDRDLAAGLAAANGPHGLLSVRQADALATDFGGLAGGRRYRLLGNLPYNISTPLLFHALTQEPGPADMHFMLQKEVVARLAAAPGGRDYGRLSVMCQNRCEVTPLFDVPPAAFSPPPRVASGFVRLLPRAEPRCGAGCEARLDRVVRKAFATRRKTLRNSLRGLVDEAGMRAAGVDPGQRAESLSLEQFIGLSRQIK